MTLRVLVVGRGKVGSALARGLARAGATVATVSGRAEAPRGTRADLVVLAVRDASLACWALKLAPIVGPRRASVVHCAGAWGLEVLAPVKAAGGTIGQFHPLLSFADRRRPPELRGARALLRGDPAAVRLAVHVARLLGIVPVRISPRRAFDAVLYHAAAALLSNGAVALANAAADLLAAAGVARAKAPAMLAPLLSSTATNLGAAGLPAALTGPVRRGDADTVAAHLDRVRLRAPQHTELMLAIVRGELGMARALGEAATPELARIARLVASRTGASGTGASRTATPRPKPAKATTPVKRR